MAIDLGRSDASFVASPATNENAGTRTHTHTLAGEKHSRLANTGAVLYTRLFVGPGK